MGIIVELTSVLVVQFPLLLGGPENTPPGESSHLARCSDAKAPDSMMWRQSTPAHKLYFDVIFSM